MNFKRDTVAISKLHFDHTNPRHGPLDAEKEIIAHLLKDEKADKIAESIANLGSVSPLDILAVVEHEEIAGHYVVLEGNRRLCALKILRDPRKAPTPALQRKIEAYVASGRAIPKELEVAVFNSVDDAMPWIDMRHLGEQDGVGTRAWGTEAKSRQATRRGLVDPNRWALGVLEYATARGIVTAEERGRLAPTTLTRYLNNPVFRHQMGLSDTGPLSSDVPQDQFDRAIERFLHDALPTGNDELPRVNSRTDAADRKSYLKDLMSEGALPTDRLPKAVPLTTAAPKQKRGPKLSDPAKRPSIVTGDFKYSFADDNVLSRIFRELRNVDVATFPFSANYLLRAFVERLMHRYAKKHGVPRHNIKLHDLIDKIVEDLKKKPAVVAAAGGHRPYNFAMKTLRTMAKQPDSAISPETLGTGVHGGSVPTKEQLYSRWESMEAGLRLVLDNT